MSGPDSVGRQTGAPPTPIKGAIHLCFHAPFLERPSGKAFQTMQEGQVQSQQDLNLQPPAAMSSRARCHCAMAPITVVEKEER